ncbi:MAG: transglutaminase-like domain-containing protein [Verrucomicrobia bacterium]|nr:transglutaminase-like domain-containing protein [Verrucomicrobiota bacterium]MCF7708561.1 transglutaminase-like domain-containing protein [Verrucomicrobiota bacterium]
MNKSGTTTRADELTCDQRKALLTLLCDEDQAVYQTIRQKIIEISPSPATWLEPYLLSDDPILRRRVNELHKTIAKRRTDLDFLKFCLNNGEGLDIEKGAALLSKTAYPDVNLEGYYALLDYFTEEFAVNTSRHKNIYWALAELNEFLFCELKFKGNERDYYNPDNNYLTRVIDRRLGNPLSICLIYTLIGRRLKMPISGIGMPGHFLCRYQSPTESIYIDAFNHGKMLSKQDCIKYLIESGHGYHESFLAPISPRRMLLRMCSNLHQTYVDAGDVEQTLRVQRYIIALSS